MSNGPGIFDNHIIRSKWNYQFTREFSLRFIGQYTATLANQNFTSLQTTKNFKRGRSLHVPAPSGHGNLFRLQQQSANLDPSLVPDKNGNLPASRIATSTTAASYS